MTTVGVAEEVGLLLCHNEETIRAWHHDYYRNQGHFVNTSGSAGSTCRLTGKEKQGAVMWNQQSRNISHNGGYLV